MWRTDTYWFDVAIATTGLMFGYMLFSAFAQQIPWWRRVAKAVLGVAIVVATTAFAGRTWTWLLVAVVVAGVILMHAWWLPRQGIHGLTGEPLRRLDE